MTGRSNIYYICVLRMNPDPADRVGIFKPHEIPRLAAVRCLVNTTACIGTAEDIGLTGTHPNDIRILRVDGYVTD